MGGKKGEMLILSYFEKLGWEGQREGRSLRTGGCKGSFVYIWVGKWPWIGLYLNDPEWEVELVQDCWLLCVCVCVFLVWGIQRGKNGLELLLRELEEECDWKWMKRITIERLTGNGNNIFVVIPICIAMGFSLWELLHSYLCSFVQQI